MLALLLLAGHALFHVSVAESLVTATEMFVGAVVGTLGSGDPVAVTASLTPEHEKACRYTVYTPATLAAHEHDDVE